MKARLGLTRRAVDDIRCPYPRVVLRVRDRYGALAPLPFRIDTAQKFRDRLRVVIAGREHDWPCDFIDVPPPAPGRRPDPLLEVPVLGRAGFLDEYAVAIGGGYLIITRLGPLRRWLRQRLHGVWQVLGMVHGTKKPL